MNRSNPDAHVRPLEAGDYDAAVALWRKCDGIGEPEPRDLFVRFLARNPGCSQSAWSGDRLVGAALVGHDGKRAYLYHLAVDADHRRRGLASAMLDAALAAVVAEGVEKATIFLIRENEPGRRFWKGVGWTERTNLAIFQMPLVPGAEFSSENPRPRADGEREPPQS